ncbi:MAG TPA: leucine zipper domain-containing protein [Thermoleophilaceae bacterium]
MSLRAAAAASSVSPCTAHRWWHRWRAASTQARADGCWSRDRSSRPHRQPRLSSSELTARICAVRRATGWGSAAGGRRDRPGALHDDQRAATVTAFLKRALAFFAGHGITASGSSAASARRRRSRRSAASSTRRGASRSRRRTRAASPAPRSRRSTPPSRAPRPAATVTSCRRSCRACSTGAGRRRRLPTNF